MKIREVLLLPIARPEYVAIPEAFISALAWRAFRVNMDNANETGFIFRSIKGKKVKQPRNYRRISTEPQTTSALDSFGNALQAEGITSMDPPRVMAQAVLNSISGIQAERGQQQPATPLSPAIALLQNTKGLASKRNPPDLGHILETLYRLGGGGTGEESLTARWLDAAEYRLQSDRLLSAIDRAVDSTLLPSPRILDKSVGHEARLLTGPLQTTPYSWLTRSWDTLTSAEWVDALPARVWVDWATTVLRLGYGMGFLWEAAWYETIAKKLLGEEQSPDDNDARFVGWLTSSVGEVLPWKSSRSLTSVRDVASLKWRVQRAGKIRKLLEENLRNASISGSLAAQWAALASDKQLRNELTIALGSKDPAASNLVWEAVRYALMTREVAGDSADYYGLLSSNGRYLTVDPGTEWIAVVASLACGSPGSTSNVAEVMRSLMELGTQPELTDLVRLLERAGLARGSADADQAVIVQSAFSRGTK